MRIVSARCEVRDARVARRDQATRVLGELGEPRVRVSAARSIASGDFIMWNGGKRGTRGEAK